MKTEDFFRIISNILRGLWNSRISWVFVGMIISYISAPYVTPFLDKHIFHKQPYVTVTLNQLMFLENPYGFIEMSKSPVVEFSFDCGPPHTTCVIYKNESMDHFQLSTGNTATTYGKLNWYNYSYSDGRVENGCNINFPIKMSLKAYGEYQFYFKLPFAAAIKLRDSGCPYSDYCLIGTFSAYNFGNKKLQDFKSKVCIDGQILHVEGDIKKKGDNCIELRSENFLPEDSLDGHFYNTPPSTLREFYAYDETNGRFPDESLIYILSVMIPDCA